MHYFKRLAAACLLAATTAASWASTFVGARSDFRDETIYFAMTTRFYDGDPKNNVCGWDHQQTQIANGDPDWRGDFAGLIKKLDYIKALGFTAIWITPIVQNCSGTDFHGYHAMDFQNVDLRYESRTEWGSEKDVKFQDLIDAAHAKGMKIILDIVLNHTGNFGEKHLAELFYRSPDIRNQASVSASLIPNYEKLPSNYNELPGTAQFNARFPYLKNSDGTNKDNHNYWHHVGTGWNWDLPNRWWGQIAGDCVDLNTENPAVSQYLVECYGKFIAMGVDGFRIDTTGHIARATFNAAFIPQFHAIAEQYREKRLNGCDFFMFGECCARFSDVTYRDQPNLSSYFYTWKSAQSTIDQWNWDPTFWDNIFIREGDDSGRYGNMALCDAEASDKPTSENVFMKNGRWHQPDYSHYSGFSVIDFPMHYNFNNAGAAVNVAKSGDKYYNDASYNVVYVDSHDYCPGPNDLTRFNGGTAQWAENLSLMFTFRGIPCIYYGTEVEFKKGCKVDAGGTDMPVKDSGRAYFGEYLEGNVTATDFGEYTADGNVAKTLDADLAQHIVRLNKIRAAVPALRKGQYTWDGCSASGGWAFKRAYKDESFACVAINGGGTFTNLPAGTYKELVTGETFTVAENGSLTLSAPTNKGQVRVAVKDYTGPVIGTDGQFIYANNATAHGGSVTFADVPATEFYTADDAIGSPAVAFNPTGTAFRTPTLTITATLNEAATTGWIKVGNAEKQNLTTGQTTTFTIGEGMEYGQSITVTWGADQYTGQETYKKVDPNAGTTIYVTGKNGADISGTNLYVWNASGKLNGDWPGKTLKETVEIGGMTFYTAAFDAETINIIFNRNGAQTPDIENVSGDVYYEYDGGTSATQIDQPGNAAPKVKANPASGTTFNGTLTVTLTASPATDIYYTLNGQEASINSTRYTEPIVLSQTTTINTYVKNENGETRQQFTYTYSDQPVNPTIHVYFDNSASNWQNVYAYCWDDKNLDATAFTGKWPGKQLTETVKADGKDLYYYTFTPKDALQNAKIIFNNGSGQQTGNFELVNFAIYTSQGQSGQYQGVEEVDTSTPLKVYVQNGTLVIESGATCTVPAVRIDGTVRTLPVEQGINYYQLPKGFYIIASTKVML